MDCKASLGQQWSALRRLPGKQMLSDPSSCTIPFTDVDTSPSLDYSWRTKLQTKAATVMWKPQDGKNPNTTHQKEGSQVVIPKRCSNKDWSFAPCVRRQVAAASLSQNLNITNQDSDLVALNVHSKTSSVSLFLNYQTYYPELSLDVAPLCGAWTCPPDCSHPWWEKLLSTAIPIQVWYGGNTICLLASSCTSAGTQKRGQPLFWLTSMGNNRKTFEMREAKAL